MKMFKMRHPQKFVAQKFPNTVLEIRIRNWSAIYLRFIRVMHLILEYYFWWHDDCFGLLIHHDSLFHFIVSISDEYKYK